jgi:nitrogen PTS system EIIA component
LKITDILDSAMVIPSLKGRDKKAVLREMAEWVAERCELMNAQKVFDVLVGREKVGSTAIGEGVAIPHGTVPGIQRVQAVFARSPQGVDFESLDGGPTYIFFLLIAPENSAGEHLKALARISRLLQDASFRASLMKGETPQEIFETISREDAKL